MRTINTYQVDYDCTGMSEWKVDTVSCAFYKCEAPCAWYDDSKNDETRVYRLIMIQEI